MKTLLGPNLSTSLPTKGPAIPWVRIKKEKAAAAADRLQPNSLRRATKKTENEYQAL